MVASQVNPCVRLACMLAERLNAVAVLPGRCNSRQVIFLFSDMKVHLWLRLAMVVVLAAWRPARPNNLPISPK
jgi:hypothetical protein